MDVKRTIAVINQARHELQRAIERLESGDSTNAVKALYDARNCITAAYGDINEKRWKES